MVCTTDPRSSIEPSLREALEDFLGDRPLTRLAVAIAVGWSLYQVVHGAAQLVDGLLTHVPSQGPFSGYLGCGGLCWEAGHRIVDIDPLLLGLIELTLAVAVGVYLRRRNPR